MKGLYVRAAICMIEATSSSAMVAVLTAQKVHATAGRAASSERSRHRPSAGTIGVATARLMHEAGAEIALVDQDAGYAAAKAAELGGIGIGCDVIDPAAVRTAFDSVVGHFGGVDIVVSNAGAAWQGRIGDALYGGATTVGTWTLHPLVLLFVLSGTLMISKTLRIPKL